MNITVTRQTLTDSALLGALMTDADFSCWTLERRPDAAEYPCVPAGTYAVTLEPTHNARLWTPYPDRYLPRLHDVPGRSGVLMHAGNIFKDTEGCILLGLDQSQEAVWRSRPAVKALVDVLRLTGGPHRVTILDLKA